LEAKHLLLVNTVDAILEEYKEINGISNSYQSNILRRHLEQSNMESAKINGIVRYTFNSDSFGVNDALRNDCMRKSFYKRRFQFVSPVEIALGDDENNQAASYQYEPIKDSLSSF